MSGSEGSVPDTGDGGISAATVSRTLDLLWGTGERARRGPKPGLTLEQVIAAAIEVADTEGLAGVSMSRVAQRLGFTTMSLYRYVSTKGELLLLAQDTAFGPPPPSTPDGAPWRPALELWGRRNLEAFRRHPWALAIPVTGVPLAPSQLAWLDAGLGILRETPLLAHDKTSVVLAVTSYVRGVAQLEHELAVGPHGAEFDSAAASAAFSAAMEKYVPPGRFPHLAEVVAAGGFDDEILPTDAGLDHEFRFGLDRLLDGVGLLIEERRPKRKRKSAARA